MTPIDELPILLAARSTEQLDARYEEKKRTLLGFVGDIDGTIDVSGRPYYIYVRSGSLEGPPWPVKDVNRVAPRVAGATVTLVEQENAPGRYKVKDISGSTPDAIAALGNSVNPLSLQYGGPNPLIVDWRQIRQGLLTESNPPDMKFWVNSFTVYYNGDIYEIPRTQVDTALTAPSSGTARYDAVSWDPVAATIDVVTGTEFDKEHPSLATKPAYSSPGVPMGYVLLNDATTTLRNGPNLKSLGPYFTWNDASGSGSSGTHVAGDGSNLTVSGGAITITGSYHTVFSSGGADLDTINGGTDGQILYLRWQGSGGGVTLKNATGNIYLNASQDKLLTQYHTVALFRASSNWYAIGTIQGIATEVFFAPAAGAWSPSPGLVSDALHYIRNDLNNVLSDSNGDVLTDSNGDLLWGS